MCVYVVLRPLLFPYEGGKALALNSACKRADFTGWMSFLLSKLVVVISPNQESLSANALGIIL